VPLAALTTSLLAQGSANGPGRPATHAGPNFYGTSSLPESERTESPPSHTHRAMQALRWVGLSRLFSQIVTWGLTIFTVRLLQPSDYGIVATAGLFTVLAGLLLDFGLSAVLVASRELPREVQGAAASALLILSMILALAIVLVAPAGGVFFKNPALVPVLRICAFQLPLSALAVVPVAVLSRGMAFRQIAIAQSVASVLQGIATLGLASVGAAYWSLIYGTLLGTALKAVAAWLFLTEKPPFNLQFSVLRPLLVSGGQMLAQRLLYFVSGDFDTFLLGRFAGAAVLGPYSLAKTASHSALDQIAGTVNQVALPSFAKLPDIDAQRGGLIAMISAAGALLFPLFWLLGTIAPVALPLVFGPRWSALVFPFTAFTIMLPLRAVYTLLDTAVVGTGGMSTTFRNMVVWAAIMMPSLAVGAFYGANATALAWCLAFPWVFLSSMIRIAKRFKTSARTLLRPLLFPAACSAASCVAMLATGLLLAHIWRVGLLCAEGTVGAVCYLLTMRKFSRPQHDLVAKLVLQVLPLRRTLNAR
jgi:teichuronic acid exporter